MAGYSGTPLHQKLGLRPGLSVHLAGPVVYKPPPGTALFPKAEPPLEFVHFFTTLRAELEERFPVLAKALGPAGMLWISWPKAGKLGTNLNENVVREVGLKEGLVDVKVCAVDDTWSALKFVRRLKDR